MFDLDAFVSECQLAARERDPRPAIREILERALSRPEAVARTLPPTRARVSPLYRSEQLSVLEVVWAPGMSFRPHNHLMWAAIGLYAGREDNVFFTRAEEGLVSKGGQELRTGDVAVLDAEVIHSVRNPRATFTGAIHVYGGDIVARPGRSEWDQATHEEVPYDFDRARRFFEEERLSSRQSRISAGRVLRWGVSLSQPGGGGLRGGGRRA